MTIGVFYLAVIIFMPFCRWCCPSSHQNIKPCSHDVLPRSPGLGMLYFLLAAAAVQCTCSGDPSGEGFALDNFLCISYVQVCNMTMVGQGQGRSKASLHMFVKFHTSRSSCCSPKSTSLPLYVWKGKRPHLLWQPTWRVRQCPRSPLPSLSQARSRHLTQAVSQMLSSV
jgi:hypothetical protein